METKTVSIEVKAGPDDGLAEGEFIVYPSTFIKEPDAYGDIVKPGAFADTIAEWTASGHEMPALYGHRMDDPDFFVGGALGSDMSEDEHGWRVKGKFDLDSPKGLTVYRLVKGRRLNQLSFAYDTLEEGQIELEDGTKANELRRLKVYEFSFVPIGANQDTSVVAVKSNAEALVEAAKAGRTLSAKNEGDIRDAVEKLTNVLSSLDNTPPDEQDGKARNTSEAKEPAAEDPETGKAVTSEEPKSGSSVAHWESLIALNQRKAGI